MAIYKNNNSFNPFTPAHTPAAPVSAAVSVPTPPPFSTTSPFSTTTSPFLDGAAQSPYYNNPLYPNYGLGNPKDSGAAQSPYYNNPLYPNYGIHNNKDNIFGTAPRPDTLGSLYALNQKQIRRQQITQRLSDIFRRRKQSW